MRFEVDDLSRPDVVALIEQHLREAFANSPPGAVFALDRSGLTDPAVTLWTAWDGDTLLGMGALKALGGGEGEIKSMRTASAAQRHGVGRAMLDHLIAAAKSRGWRKLSLETGGNAAFAPARAMYVAAGFVECGPFGEYDDTSFSRYFMLGL